MRPRLTAGVYRTFQSGHWHPKSFGGIIPPQMNGQWTRNNVPTTYTDQTGKFAKGNPGRPKGSRHKYVLAIQGLLDSEAEGLGRKAIELALAGDTTALRLCVERIMPPPKDTPVQFDLPPMTNAQEAAKAAQGVIQAVSDGELTPHEATMVMGLVERFRRVLELSEFEGRLAALEDRQ